MIFGAGKLAHYLADHGWEKIPPGADHTYLVIEAIDNDQMMIADNQRDDDVSHLAASR